MCVSGALDRDNRAQTCAINMADMILAVFKDCKKLHEDGRLPALEIRAGLNSGPIVAGLFFQFCWARFYDFYVFFFSFWPVFMIF